MGWSSSGRAQARFLPRVAVEQYHFPLVERNVITQNVDTAILTTDFKVAVVGIQPAIDDFDNVDRALADKKPPG